MAIVFEHRLGFSGIELEAFVNHVLVVIFATAPHQPPPHLIAVDDERDDDERRAAGKQRLSPVEILGTPWRAARRSA
jgi:hypothetical protein